MKRMKTVKKQTILAIVSYSIIVAVVVLTFSFYLMNTFHRRTAVNSAEFNLQLVANMIEQDMISLTTLTAWCANESSEISKYFSPEYTQELQGKIVAIDAYNSMSDEFTINQSSMYARRLVAVSTNNQKILQTGSDASGGMPLSADNIERLWEAVPENTTSWKVLNYDPFYRSRSVQAIFLRQSIQDNISGNEIGQVALLASTTMITDKLKNYSLTGNAQLYLQLGQATYQIKDNGFILIDESETVTDRSVVETVSPKTVVTQAKNGDKKVLVSYPVREGVYIAQSLDSQPRWIYSKTWILPIVLIIIMICGLAVLILLNIERTINRPVKHIRHKIDEIAKGDFTQDLSIEYPNELGQVGQGINHLAGEIVHLMEKRIADENDKRDLEYRMLLNQINPHFLYNTLNSIKWMATMQGAKGIAEMTTALSRLLKAVSKDIRKVVPLEDELNLIKEYMIIQKYRYGDSVALETFVEEEELLKTLLPRFSLQPIIENAIFHGIEPKDSGNISIKITRRENNVNIIIKDDGVGIAPESLSNIFSDNGLSSGMFKGIGLKNVDERIKYAFGQSYGIKAESEINVHTTMTICLPYNREGEVKDD